jgi:SAM-dependent methyltransferase
MSLATSSLTCVVCKGPDVKTLKAAAGERAYCMTCFHGWRIELRPYAYNQTAMCSLGTSQDRLDRQVRFFAPFAHKDASILEVGCATGELAQATRGALKPARYDAIELSPAGEAARAHVDRLFNRTLTELLSRGSINEDYDLILMSHVLEHIADPAAELAQLKRVLKPDGALFIEAPNGSGNRKLPIDDNSSHLHFFSAPSLTRLLADQGLQTIAAATDVRLDARYADSLQVVARPFHVPAWTPTLLSDHPAFEGATDIVVWGAGSLVEELLANFFDPGKIAYFVDRDPRKQDGLALGKPIRPPEALAGENGRTILANSIDYGPAIATDIAVMFAGAGHKVIQMSEILS